MVPYFSLVGSRVYLDGLLLWSGTDSLYFYSGSTGSLDGVTLLSGPVAPLVSPE